MLKNLLEENDRLKIKSETIQKFDSANAKLSSEHKMNVENFSEFDERSEISEILVDDVVDYSKYLKSETDNAKPLITKNSEKRLLFIRRFKRCRTKCMLLKVFPGNKRMS